MKAGVASPNGVIIQDVPEPKPKPTDILVKVKAIALNRADLGSARGDTSHVPPVGARRRPVLVEGPPAAAERLVSAYFRPTGIQDRRIVAGRKRWGLRRGRAQADTAGCLIVSEVWS